MSNSITDNMQNVKFSDNYASKQGDNLSSQITKQKEDFLALLVASVKAQDPMNPMENHEATQQYIGFTAIEQNVKTHELLENIYRSLGGSQLDNATSYIGKEIEYDTSEFDISVPGAVQKIRYNLGEKANDCKIDIVNNKGVKIQTISGTHNKGFNEIEWNGVDFRNQLVPEGKYKLQINATKFDKGSNGLAQILPVQTATTQTAVIKAVKLINNKLVLEDSSGHNIEIEKVNKLSNPNANQENHYNNVSLNWPRDADGFRFNINEDISGETIYAKITDSKNDIITHVPLTNLHKGSNEFKWNGLTKEGKKVLEGEYYIDFINSTGKTINFDNISKTILSNLN